MNDRQIAKSLLAQNVGFKKKKNNIDFEFLFKINYRALQFFLGYLHILKFKETNLCNTVILIVFHYLIWHTIEKLLLCLNYIIKNVIFPRQYLKFPINLNVKHTSKRRCTCIFYIKFIHVKTPFFLLKLFGNSETLLFLT